MYVPVWHVCYQSQQFEIVLNIQLQIQHGGFRSVVVITLASHARGPGFETQQKQVLQSLDPLYATVPRNRHGSVLGCTAMRIM